MSRSAQRRQLGRFGLGCATSVSDICFSLPVDGGMMQSAAT
jgi:hypothetical protein